MSEWDFVNRRKAYLQPNSACQLRRLRLSIRWHACHAKKADLTLRQNCNINEQCDCLLLSMPLVFFAPLCLHLTFSACDAVCLFLSLSFSHADLHWAPWKGDPAFHVYQRWCQMPSKLHAIGMQSRRKTEIAFARLMPGRPPERQGHTAGEMAINGIQRMIYFFSLPSGNKIWQTKQCPLCSVYASQSESGSFPSRRFEWHTVRRR